LLKREALERTLNKERLWDQIGSWESIDPILEGRNRDLLGCRGPIIPGHLPNLPRLEQAK